MIKKSKRYLSLMLTGAILLSNMAGGIKVSAETLSDEVTQEVTAEETGYEIYPKPQNITYKDSDFIIRKDVNVVYEDGVDIYTKNRLKEVTDLKDLNVTESKSIVEGKTNILVGVDGSGEYVDKYAEKYTLNDTELFNKIDSYLLAVDNEVITVLGKDTDAAFYGLTTLYHVFAQLESYTIRDFVIEDYANVVTRGFIEGYYGNPWSVEDRSDLMTYGGYYKLNAYFYAPKDDPKHRTNWRQLYTEDELVWIKQLADAGNASKTRFVYGIHPFPGNDPFAMGKNSGQYDRDLNDLKSKLKQVIDQGVRQIAILADDFANPGGELGLKLVNDITAWLENEVKAEYPDMKTTLPYIPYDYMGNGSGNEFTHLKQAPDNVQLVMTGGKVWGEVAQNFSETFKNNTGRAPYYWINWPCTDNSKKHLIMGGNDTFLHPGVDSDLIEGIMLNPMQQSEANKSALFAVADYSWNIWDNKAQADENWNDSFKYMDHNSAIETESSKALREISKHMINQNMDGRVAVLQESVELAPKLNSFKTKYDLGSNVKEDALSLIEEFTKLKDAASYYKNNPGNKKTRDQIIYWLNSWEDTTTSVISYLKAIIANEEGNSGEVLSYYTEGQAAFEKSKTYGFNYVDHLEYAEVGVQHIVPFIKKLENSLAPIVASTVDPSKVIATVITNREDTPAGDLSNVLDNNPSTEVVYKNPTTILAGTYIGVKYNKAISIKNAEFLLGTSANAADTMEEAKVQYTVDGIEWIDLNEELYKTPSKITLEDLDLDAMGIRVIATKDRTNKWFGVRDININTNDQDGGEEPLNITVSTDKIGAGSSTDYTAVIDGNKDSMVHFRKSPYEYPNRDTIPENATITFTLDNPITLGTIYLKQDSGSDRLKDAVLEYSADGTTGWIELGRVVDGAETLLDVESENITAKAVRVRNKTVSNFWWKLYEFQLIEAKASNTPIEYNLIKSDSWGQYQASNYPLSNLTDGNISSFVWFDPDVPQRPSGSKPDIALANDFIGYDLGTNAVLDSAYIVVGADNGDKLINYTIETSLDNNTWTAVKGYENYTGNASGKDILNIDLNGTKARYIRIRNLSDRASWLKFSEFTVKQKVGGESANVYTNVKTDILSVMTEGKAELTQGRVTLNKDEYIGLKLDNIKEIANIEVEPALESGLKLQVSKNALIWNDINTKASDYEDSRYIRIINTSNDVKEINLQKFAVTSNEVFEKGFYDSNIAIDSNYGQNDMRNTGDSWKIFDKNLAIGATLSGYPTQDGYVTFDLGQEMNINSIRYYLVETQINFIRDAVFEVSNDPKGSSWTEVLSIGDGIQNTERGANESGSQLNVKEYSSMDEAMGQYIHDSKNPGNMYVESEGLNAKGRYLRVRFTAPYNYRFVTFDEILINGGAYYPVENNKDYDSNVIEEEGKRPSNMNDGDLTTTYKPSKENGYMTYRLSEPTGITSIRFIQKGNASNAKISGKLYSNGTVEEVDLGILNQTITEFIVPDGKTLLEATISWEKNIPEISEIFTFSNKLDKVDKSNLEAEIKKTADENWTSKSKEEYNKALNIAKDVAGNIYVSQESVNLAFNTLVAARQNANIKADATELKKMVDNAVSNENNIYSVKTYTVYENALNNIKKALLDEENLSKEEATKLEQTFVEAKNALVYSISKREEAELILKDAPEYNVENYTEESYKNMVAANEELRNTVETDKNADNSNRVSPEEMAIKIEAYNSAVANLVDVSVLKASIAEFDTFDKNLYTPESYEAYKVAVENAKSLLINGTVEQVNKAIEAINTTKAGLKIEDLEDLNKVIEDAKKVNAENYTETSYAILKAAIEEAEAITDPSKAEELINKINNAKNGLVNIVALKAKLSEIEKLDREKYTKSSYEKLLATVEEASNIMKNGTTEDVKSMIEKLEASVKSLELRAANMKAYLDSITLKEAEEYTEESYAAYKKAYDELMALPLDDTNTEKFNVAKDAFEKAEISLQLKEKDEDDGENPPSNGGNENNGGNNNGSNGGTGSGDGSNDGTNSGNGNNGGTNSDSNSGSNSGNSLDDSNKDDLPETGSAVSSTQVIIISMLVIGVGLVLLKKRKATN